MRILLFLLLLFSITHAQENTIILNEILDKIYMQEQEQENQKKNLGDYKYKQFIHFVKMDGDGEIDEQSKREFFIYVKSDSIRKRQLISALDYEDGAWKDITEKKKNSKVKSERRSKRFSLSEMVSPEYRQFYEFEIIGEKFIDTLNTIQLRVYPIEEDEDRFKGDLWFDLKDYNLIKAELIPSDMPTFVDEMSMFFKMQKIDSIWFPKKINFQADVSVLFFFSGKIHSEILFSDFEFNQQFEKEWFNNLENAE